MIKNFSKKQKVLLIIAMFLFATILGLTYAYFVLTTNGNDTDKKNVTRSGKLEITLDGESTMSSNNLEPGDSLTKTFSVKNTGTINIASYDIYFSDLVNTYQYDELISTVQSD